MEPMWCNGSTVAWNVRDVGLIPVLDTISNFHHSHNIHVYISHTFFAESDPGSQGHTVVAPPVILGDVIE